jgi:hypothetical protein
VSVYIIKKLSVVDVIFVFFFHNLVYIPSLNSNFTRFGFVPFAIVYDLDKSNAEICKF